MAKEFVVRVAQDPAILNFNWVVRGMGKYVAVIRAEEVVQEDGVDYALEGSDSEYLVYHTGPPTALYSVPGEGFVYTNSPRSDDGEPIPEPWNP